MIDLLGRARDDRVSVDVGDNPEPSWTAEESREPLDPVDGVDLEGDACPVCRGPVQWDQPDHDVGFSGAVYCENQACGWHGAP